MRAGAPELDSREAIFEQQQEQEAQVAAAAAAQRREDAAAAATAELKDPTPELGNSSISARAAAASGADDGDAPGGAPTSRPDRPDGRRAMRSVETQSDDKAGDWQSFDLGKL
jgi:hypothetical protein